MIRMVVMMMVVMMIVMMAAGRSSMRPGWRNVPDNRLLLYYGLSAAG